MNSYSDQQSNPNKLVNYQITNSPVTGAIGYVTRQHNPFQTQFEVPRINIQPILANLLTFSFLYVIHELGHIIALLLFGIEFNIIILPIVSGTPHIIGIARLHSNNLAIELLIRFVFPIMIQVIVLFIA